MKKIYISLPMANCEDTVAKRYNDALEYINNSLKDEYEIHGPTNIEDFLNGKKVREHEYSWYIGRDIEELLKCDTIFMCSHWNRSCGCRCELATAKIYDKEIIYQQTL